MQATNTASVALLLAFNLLNVQSITVAADSLSTGATAASNSSECSVEVKSLTCESLSNPLGIDRVHPQLSWLLEAKEASRRGQRQTAYQVLVASSTELLDANEGDLWNSGKVDSAESVHVIYAGKPLQSDQLCFWKVRVWDESSLPSSWSPVGSWSMGILSVADWKAEWISSGQEFLASAAPSAEDCTIWDPWFRKKFVMHEAVERAEIHVASVGYFELYVNGQKVSDHVLAPAVCNHKTRARYVTYDITKHLRKGQNVLALWLGTSWSIYPSYQTSDKPKSPIALAQAKILGVNGSNTLICTDSSWRWHPSANKLLGSWEFRNFGGELYDANREIRNWNQIGFDDTNWQQAAICSPALQLSSEMIEPNRFVQTLVPQSIEPVGDDAYRIDFGKNFVGQLAIHLKGEPGNHVEILSSEREDEPVTHRMHSTYVFGPQGEGTFRHRFNYHSGRWVTLKGLRRQPHVDEVRGYFVRSDYQRAGHFACSDKLLNQIYETTLWTFENLSLGGYVVDCPQRERMGYGGDAHATILTGLNNYALGAFYTKWNQDWHDTQFADGYLPHTAPTYWGGGGPAWSGYCVTMPWEVYLRYGDLRILEQSWPVIQNWLQFLGDHSEAHMLVRWPGREGCASDRWSFLGDWLWPNAKGTNSHTRQSLFVNNCYWIYNLETAAKIAKTIGDTEAFQQYREDANQVRTAVHQEFYDEHQGNYGQDAQFDLAIALLVDLPPKELREQIWHHLEKEILETRGGHIHAGITGGAFLFKLLMDTGRNDLLHTMISKADYPGWGYMLEQGATTIWESWEARPVGSSDSKLHSSYLYVGAWPLQGMLGLRPAESTAGFQQFEIQPSHKVVQNLHWFNASYQSDYGEIECCYRTKDRSNHWLVTVPPNTKATFHLPIRPEQTLTEANQSLDSVAGIKITTREASQLVLQLQPGRYHFVASERSL